MFELNKKYFENSTVIGNCFDFNNYENVHRREKKINKNLILILILK